MECDTTLVNVLEPRGDREMTQDIEQIEYRSGLLEPGMSVEDFPVKVLKGAKVPSEVHKAIREEDILNLGGFYGDKDAGDPLQYDHLKIILTYDTVEITFFNRAIALGFSDNEVFRRIHRVFGIIGVPRKRKAE